MAWDASPSPEVTGYTLGVGTNSGNYTTLLDCGTNLTMTVTNPPTPAFIAVQAHTADGTTSDWSNEVALPDASCPAPNASTQN